MEKLTRVTLTLSKNKLNDLAVLVNARKLECNCITFNLALDEAIREYKKLHNFTFSHTSVIANSNGRNYLSGKLVMVEYTNVFNHNIVFYYF